MSADGPFVLCYDGSEAAERAIAGVALARDAGFDVEPLVVEADRHIAEIIAATAEEVDAGKSALLGSVSRDVVNAYHRPVIVV